MKRTRLSEAQKLEIEIEIEAEGERSAAPVARAASSSPPSLPSSSRVVDGGVTATGVLSRQRGNLITIVSTR